MPKPIEKGAASEGAAPAPAPLNGVAERAFACLYRGLLIGFAAGSRIEGDAALARYLAEHKLPVAWDRN